MAATRDALARIEQKLDAVLRHHGIKYAEVQQVNNPETKGVTSSDAPAVTSTDATAGQERPTPSKSLKRNR